MALGHHTDVLELRITPMVFAALFTLGVWADPISLFGFGWWWPTRVSFIAATTAMVVSAVWPATGSRFMALAFGIWAAVGRGLILLIEGQDGTTRKSEIIGGSIWMAVAYLVLFTWVVTVPTLAWRRER